MKSQDCSLQDLQAAHFEPYPSAAAGIQELPYFSPFNHFFHNTYQSHHLPSRSSQDLLSGLPRCSVNSVLHAGILRSQSLMKWGFGSKIQVSMSGIPVVIAYLVPDTATVNYVTGYEPSPLYSCCMISLFSSSHPPFLYSIATLH